jgi:hypothetical protein
MKTKKTTIKKHKTSGKLESAADNVVYRQLFAQAHKVLAQNKGMQRLMKKLGLTL